MSVTFYAFQLPARWQITNPLSLAPVKFFFSQNLSFKDRDFLAKEGQICMALLAHAIMLHASVHARLFFYPCGGLCAKAFSIACFIFSESGATALSKRARIEPSLPIKNFSKFHFILPGGLAFAVSH